MAEITVRKELSANDVGKTGGHQAGMLIPKQNAILAFFPTLDANDYNPRQSILFTDDAGDRRTFNFIYYNNKLHGRGTRNEYRLTGMTKFLREANLKVGDAILLTRSGDDYGIRIERAGAPEPTSGKTRLVLTAGWVIVEG